MQNVIGYLMFSKYYTLEKISGSFISDELHSTASKGINPENLFSLATNAFSTHVFMLSFIFISTERLYLPDNSL